jgi:hypothetical protein
LNNHGAVREALHWAQLFPVIFVANFPHDLFQQIFQGRQTLHFTEFVNHQSYGEAAALQLLEQLADAQRAGNKERWMEMIANVKVGFFLQGFEDILVIENADDAVQFTLIHWNP